MSAAKSSAVLVRVLTWAAVAFAGALVVAGIVELVLGNAIGWLLILFAPVSVLLNWVRVAQLRERQRIREEAEQTRPEAEQAGPGADTARHEAEQTGQGGRTWE